MLPYGRCYYTKKRRLAIKHTIVRLNADTTRIHTCQRTSFYFRVTLYVKIHFTCCYRTQTPILHKLIFKLCFYKKRIHYFILAYYSLVWQHRFVSGQPSRQLRLCSVSTPPHTLLYTIHSLYNWLMLYFTYQHQVLYSTKNAFALCHLAKGDEQ